MVEPKSFHSAT